MIYAIKKLPNIALQNVARPRVVPRGFSYKTTERTHSFMSTVTYATRERSGNKGRFKYEIQNGKNSMM